MNTFQQTKSSLNRSDEVKLIWKREHYCINKLNTLKAYTNGQCSKLYVGSKSTNATKEWHLSIIKWTIDTMNSEIHPHMQKRMERNEILIKNLERKICIQIYTQQMPMHKSCLQFTIVETQSWRLFLSHVLHFSSIYIGKT